MQLHWNAGKHHCHCYQCMCGVQCRAAGFRHGLQASSTSYHGCKWYMRCVVGLMRCMDCRQAALATTAVSACVVCSGRLDAGMDCRQAALATIIAACAYVVGCWMQAWIAGKQHCLPLLQVHVWCVVGLMHCMDCRQAALAPMLRVHMWCVV